MKQIQRKTNSVGITYDSVAGRQGEARMPSTGLGEYVAGQVNAVARSMEELAASNGLIPLDFALLKLFLEREEWTITQLAEALPVNVSRVSRVVTKMVGMGLIRRPRRRSDRRVVMLALTEEGKALTLDLHRSVQAYDARLSEGVSEEDLTVFAYVLSKVMVNYTALQTGRNGSH